jgi:hypothetical protein
MINPLFFVRLLNKPHNGRYGMTRNWNGTRFQK